jgi:hypothetical protein
LQNFRKNVVHELTCWQKIDVMYSKTLLPTAVEKEWQRNQLSAREIWQSLLADGTTTIEQRDKQAGVS